MEEQDPLARIEQMIAEMHQTMHAQVHTAHRKYPLLFLLVITVCIAAIFHGLDLLMDQFAFASKYPLALVLLGVLGLFLTGSLYKRLGKDKFD